jgi:hypothetical protein
VISQTAPKENLMPQEVEMLAADCLRNARCAFASAVHATALLFASPNPIAHESERRPIRCLEYAVVVASTGHQFKPISASLIHDLSIVTAISRCKGFLAEILGAFLEIQDSPPRGCC